MQDPFSAFDEIEKPAVIASVPIVKVNNVKTSMSKDAFEGLAPSFGNSQLKNGNLGVKVTSSHLSSNDTTNTHPHNVMISRNEHLGNNPLPLNPVLPTQPMLNQQWTGPIQSQHSQQQWTNLSQPQINQQQSYQQQTSYNGQHQQQSYQQHHSSNAINMNQFVGQNSSSMNGFASQVDPFGTLAGFTGNTTSAINSVNFNVQSRPPEVPLPPNGLLSNSMVKSNTANFDPFSPHTQAPKQIFDFAMQHSANTPVDSLPAAPLGKSSASGAIHERQGKRLTQEEQRSKLSVGSANFATAAISSPKISLKSLSIHDDQTNTPISGVCANGKLQETNCSKTRINCNTAPNDAVEQNLYTNDNTFAGQSFSNPDDHDNTTTQSDWGQNSQFLVNAKDVDPKCGPNEYDVTFETGKKLGVLMERVETLKETDDRRKEIAVVKLVVENGAADLVGVTVGSVIIAINRKSVEKEAYFTILDMIKMTPRPMTIRFRRGTENKDVTQGTILTRISNGTFSVGNLTSGNAQWDEKYFAFGGAKMNVLQLFVSRAVYHECVIALYEKREVSTQIQSFRLCRDHKLSPIKSKIYKGYGNLHYFSLTVPSLRFIAAKFASDDYEMIKTLWSKTYEAIERKKRT